MKKINTLLVTSLIPLVGLWGFNFAGFTEPKTLHWAVWTFINLILAGAFIGCMVGLFILTQRTKSTNALTKKSVRHLHALSIGSFVIIPIVYVLDWVVIILDTNKAPIMAIVAVNMILIGILLGLCIYATVKAFQHKKTVSKTTTTTTTTTTQK